MLKVYHEGRKGHLSIFWWIILFLDFAFILTYAYFTFLVNPFMLNGQVGVPTALMTQLHDFQTFTNNSFKTSQCDFDIVNGIATVWMFFNFVFFLCAINTPKGKISFGSRLTYILSFTFLAFLYFFVSFLWLITNFENEYLASFLSTKNPTAYYTGFGHNYQNWLYHSWAIPEFGNYRWLAWLIIFGHLLILFFAVSLKKLGYKKTLQCLKQTPVVQSK